MSFTFANKNYRGRDVKTSTFAGSFKPAKKNKKDNNNNNNLYDISRINSSNSINHLQRSIGNQAVQRLMHVDGGFDFEIAIQPKLKVSRPGDSYEQEADRAADEVMKMSSSSPESNAKLSMSPANNAQLDRKCSGCQMNEEEGKEKLTVSRKPSSNSSDLEASDEIAEQINNIRTSSGSLLDSSTREVMESRFGHDFSKVRIHTGEMAHRSANNVNALAYTIGDDIVFEEGQYQPDTSAGRRLLAHELTHVVQQSSNTASSGSAGFITSNISSTERISRQKAPTAAAPVETLEERFKHAILKSDWINAVDRLATFSITEISKLLERYVITQFALNNLKEAAIDRFGSDESTIIPAINALIKTKFRVPAVVK